MMSNNKLTSLSLNDCKEVSIICNAINSKKDSGSYQVGDSYIDIGFVGNNMIENNFNYLVFRNNYTSAISISQQTSAGTWNVILPKKILMENCNVEQNAQSIHYINTTEFNNLYVVGKPLRILLLQYSSIWSNYDIRNVKAIALSKTNNNDNDNNNKNDTDISITKQISDDMILLSNIQKSAARTTDYSLYKLSKRKSGDARKKRKAKKEKTETTPADISYDDSKK